MLAHHNTETGLLSIKSRYDDVEVFSETDPRYTGKEGIRVAGRIQAAIREAEQIAFDAGMNEARRLVRDALK